MSEVQGEHEHLFSLLRGNLGLLEGRHRAHASAWVQLTAVVALCLPSFIWDQSAVRYDQGSAALGSRSNLLRLMSSRNWLGRGGDT
jgi:hypothetical protein